MLIIRTFVWIWGSWRDLLSVVGFLLTIVGFGVTFVTLFRTKAAAEAAKDAAGAVSAKVRKDLVKFDTVSGITSVISAVENLLALQRQNDDWSDLPQRYTELRATLVELKALNPDLTEKQQTIIQSAISEFANVEELIDEANQEGAESLNKARINRVLSTQNVNLIEVRMELRSEKDE